MKIVRPTIMALTAAVSAALVATPAAQATPADFFGYLNCLKQGGIAYSNINDAFTLKSNIILAMHRRVSNDAIVQELEDVGMSQTQATAAVSCVAQYPV